MAILKIYTFPNNILRQKCTPVDNFDSSLKTLVEDMLETMYAAPGVGLAANQVGKLSRVLVLDYKYSIDSKDGTDESVLIYKNQNPEHYINPEIISKSGSIIYREGCLSVPGVNEEVERFSKIKIKFQDLNGNHHEEELEGFKAVIVQHEMDHLDGKVFLDRLSAVKKSLIVGKIKKGVIRAPKKDRKHVEL